MSEIEFYTPKTLNEAVDLLAQGGGTPIAGGTDLVILMKGKIVKPKRLINLRQLDLDYIEQENGIIRIGAMTIFEEISESSIIREKMPVLSEAAAHIGAVQCRSIGTIGGNICSAVPSADAAPALMALNAQAKILNNKGERLVRVSDFFVGPRKTILNKDDLLVEIQVPIPPVRSGAFFYKHGRRKALTLSTVSSAVYLQLEQNNEKKIEDARVVLGAVAPTPIHATKTEAALMGKEISEELFRTAAETASGEIKPISDVRASKEYRYEIARVLVERSLREAATRADQNNGSLH